MANVYSIKIIRTNHSFSKKEFEYIVFIGRINNMKYSITPCTTICRIFIFIVIAIFALTVSVEDFVDAKSATTIDIYIKGTVDYDFADKVFQLVNKARVDEGLPELTMNTDGTDSANIRARECILKYSHRRPVSDEWTALMPAGYTYVGENLAIGYDSAESVVEAWLDSPSHRANIMNTEYVSLGIGVFRYVNPQTNKTLYACTQHFSNTFSNDKVQSGQYMSSYPVTVDTDVYPLEVHLYVNEKEKKKISMHQGDEIKPMVTLKAEEIWGDDDIVVEPESLKWKFGQEDIVEVTEKGHLKAVGVGVVKAHAYTIDGKFQKTLDISVKKTITSVVMDAIKPQLYTGDHITPKLTLTDGKKELVEGKDYKLRYSDNIYTGTASIIIKGKGSYGGSAIIYFSIYDESTEIKASWWDKLKDLLGFN